MEPAKVSGVAVKKRRKFIGCSPLEHFELGQKVGVGTFGEVLKAKHLSSGKVVALKKIFTKSEQEGFPITSLREIKLLKNVSHPNISGLIDMAVSYQKDSKEIEDVYMVFPFMDHDLTGLLENPSIKLTVPQIKCYMKQLLEGLAYLHSRQIMHRDLKGANLLVNNKGELKITDFGLARPLEENRTKYTPGVVTRWYRPPELLFGTEEYTESIDIWGAGCIIAETYLCKPLFGASSDLEQLQTVCKFCGTPTEENYPGVSKLPDYSKVHLKMEKRIIKEYLLGKNLDVQAVDLIDKMLVLDPKRRITAREALEHEYFKCEPLPCLPSEIGKFESSHLYTVQLREQEKEKELLETRGTDAVKSRDYHHQSNPNYNRRSNYLDFDRQRPNRSHSDNLRYSQDRPEQEALSPPPPPPPPPPVETVRDRRVHDQSHSREQRDKDYDRDYENVRDYYDHYGHREFNRSHSHGHRSVERRVHSSHSHRDGRGSTHNSSNHNSSQDQQLRQPKPPRSRSRTPEREQTRTIFSYDDIC